ncbi:MAG: TRAP transporter small permease subunit [Alphaproteobacteria bacterium]|nr:TRAP transporter small permease subunit [Alphaproteobacteria bacterium]
MGALAALVTGLTRINTSVLWLGRHIAWMALALMTAIILLQVFFRYVLNSALPWPEEAARALMIWMMALIAPGGYRWGAFVSIDMASEALPPTLRRILTLTLLLMSTVVLSILLYQAIQHFNSGFIFRSSTLKIPLAYVYLGMSVCFGLMLSVNVELALRTIGRMLGDAERFKKPEPPGFVGAD